MPSIALPPPAPVLYQFYESKQNCLGLTSKYWAPPLPRGAGRGATLGFECHPASRESRSQHAWIRGPVAPPQSSEINQGRQEADEQPEQQPNLHGNHVSVPYLKCDINMTEDSLLPKFSPVAFPFPKGICDEGREWDRRSTSGIRDVKNMNPTTAQTVAPPFSATYCES